MAARLAPEAVEGCCACSQAQPGHLTFSGAPPAVRREDSSSREGAVLNSFKNDDEL
jgi:hypothetical protein